MVCRARQRRIPRFATECSALTIWLACVMVLALHGAAPSRNRGGDIAHRASFYSADAFSVPQPVVSVDATRPQHIFADGATTRCCGFGRKNDHRATTATVAAAASSTRLSAGVPFYATDTEVDKPATDAASPAFLIQSITAVPSSGDDIYKSIANLCINVFFQELIDPSGRGNVNPIKAWQIRYLKNLQAADLERRRNRQPDTNEMFLAYEVRETRNAREALRQPLLMDEELAGAYNLPSSSSTGRGVDTETAYVRGDMLGFVEVTQRPYGLGTTTTTMNSSSSSSSSSGGGLLSAMAAAGPSTNTRPVLTNLAVLKRFRGCGIGSKLLEACEEHVVRDWNMNEIVLEVEDYNDSGLSFYKRKGYTVLFSDPASRRFDIQGFWLNKVRCRRDIMRKALDRKPTSIMKTLRRIRKTISL